MHYRGEGPTHPDSAQLQFELGNNETRSNDGCGICMVLDYDAVTVIFSRGPFGFPSSFKTAFRNRARRMGGCSRLWRGQIKVHWGRGIKLSNVSLFIEEFYHAGGRSNLK